MPIFRRKPDDEHVDFNARSPKLGLNNKDLILLNQLLEHGADLGQPRHARYFSYFPTRHAAEQAAARAVEGGFQAQVSEPVAEYPNDCLVLCEIHGVVLDPATVIAHRDLFESIAHRHGGEYDGWEASV